MIVYEIIRRIFSSSVLVPGVSLVERYKLFFIVFRNTVLSLVCVSSIVVYVYPSGMNNITFFFSKSLTGFFF